MAIFLKFTAIVILTSVFGVAEAQDSNKLFSEDVSVSTKAAECVFGKQRYELGSQWTPDLGPPTGILSCMRCRCVPFQKKRRIVARVHCYSIKEQCPKPKCEEPIMLPGRCCKICPGDISPDTAQDILPQNIVEIEEKTNKQFVSILTSHIPLKANPSNKTNLVATARFSFNQNNLYYSFYTSESATRPQVLQFINTQGNILEEFSISNSTNNPYQNASKKICGVWKRLARDYQKLLRQEKLYAVLVWKTKGQELTLSGSIKKNNALESELLSSLLEPTSNSMLGAGGTAMVSPNTDLTVKITVIFKGLFMPSEIANVPIRITLSLKKHLIFQENINILKPATDLNTIEFNAKISEDYFKCLTKGEMILDIASVSKPEQLKLSGKIRTRARCEMFQATLASSDPGMSWLYLNDAGSLIYNVRMGNNSQPIASLVQANSKMMIDDTSLTLNSQENGWANGTMDKLTPKVLQSLYAGDLSINVVTSRQVDIKGRLNIKYMDEARDSSAPVLLREQSSVPMNMNRVGMAWISVDSDCYLQYDVSLKGLESDRKLELWLELYPLIAPGAPFINKSLESFQGTSIEGSPVEVLTRDELSMLESGVSYLKVKDAGSQVVLLMATVVKVSIPASCRPYISLDKRVSLDDHPEIVQTDKCFFEGKFHKNEEIWVPSNNSCQMCFCQNGRAKCDSMTCPELSCTYGRKTVVEGECCPVCTNDSRNVSSAKGPKCVLNGKSYLPGSKFHPFLLPIGFDLCTECYCHHQQYQIKCIRLTNTEKCSNRKTFDINDPFSDDFVELQENVRTETKKEDIAVKILSEGGCKNPINARKPYINGSKYHPFIDSLGEYKCVTCKCQNGNAQCSRQHCDKSTCKQMYEIRRKKGKVNPSEFCCALKDCRKLRYKKKAN